jgi:hypothetical protein
MKQLFLAMIVSSLSLSACAHTLRSETDAYAAYAAAAHGHMRDIQTGHVSGYGGYGDCPDQGVAMLDRPVFRCDAGNLLVMFKNQETGLTWRIYLDGEELSVNGETVYEGIPPRANAWVLLDAPGYHSVSGEAYVLRGNQWVKVGEFDTHAVWNRPNGADNFHIFHLNQALLDRY